MQIISDMIREVETARKEEAISEESWGRTVREIVSIPKTYELYEESGNT